MVIQLSRKTRSLLALVLNSLALGFAVSAFATSYWCEGTHKVVKPPCLSAIRKGNCVPVGANETEPGNATLDPNVVQYIWETGEDKYAFRYFHTGFWLSCEERHRGEICRSFIELPPESEKGEQPDRQILRGTFSLLPGEICRSFIELPPESEKGLLGMVAHMMYMTVFQVAVNLGPKDWRPQTWYYGWSFG
nr:germ cell-specific gene 1-like protein [Pelodiscus sinensis]|eukprot:XP_025034913.1 germ cell-specific gene 1-like protein [Pelodiscus sinensis]